MADIVGVRKVIKVAILSRLLSLLAQGISNNILADYDTSAEPYRCSQSNSTGDYVISLSLGGNAKWDAVYFLDIAQHGYQYEQNMAFFPLFPLIVFSLTRILGPLLTLLNFNDESIFLLSATLINTVTFVLAAVGLNLLTRSIFNDQKLAQKVVALFCFNPASVFFSAAYSESTFAMTQFWGMWFLERKPRSYFAAALFFMLGSVSRSNGIISCGFIGYKILQEIFALCFELESKDKHVHTIMAAVTLKLMNVMFCSILIVLPFMLFQCYGYNLFCKSPHPSPWCNTHLPLPYFYIQKHYWNVGFLKYYELKQLPNFFLASPTVLMSIVGIFEYLSHQSKRDIMHLGLATMKKENSLNIFVYLFHLGFLLVFGLTSMHVQVITRMIASSSPLFYWIAVSWISAPRHNKHLKLKSNFVYLYFLLYYSLGYLLHCNFYPWT